MVNKGKEYRISQRVDNYIQYRPHYPTAVLDLLKEHCGLTTAHLIADIGSGTGIFTKLFLKNGNPVFGIEPDPEMRAGAEYYLQQYTGFTSVAATAEATSLPNHSVDFVTAGQAFHWFDLEAARREFLRILIPGGWVILAWNVQKAAGTPFLEALQGFWEDKRFWKSAPSKQSQEMDRVQAYRLDPDLTRQELLEPFFGRDRFEDKMFQNPLVCDLEGLIGRVLSNRPSLESDDPLYETMLSTLEEIFMNYQENGTVTIDHDTRVVYGQLSMDKS